MNKSLEQVKEFHTLFGHPISEKIGEESLKNRQLRIKVLFEELEELSVAGDVRGTFIKLCNQVIDDAITNDDPSFYEDGDNVNHVEELDALCDIQYVLSGKVLTGGYQKVFDEANEVVHANNITKAHSTHEHAVETLDKSLKGQGTVFERNGKFLVNNLSGKLIKPWDHKKVSLQNFIQ